MCENREIPRSPGRGVVLEREWEARLDPKQYGFRPGRGCHDAIEMIHRAVAARNAKRGWVLDADLNPHFRRFRMRN
jgi:RNA-directed DNA polymerase